MNSTRSYLRVQSEVRAQDMAAALGLSLSPHPEAAADRILETGTSAIFDRGYYSSNCSQIRSSISQVFA